MGPRRSAAGLLVLCAVFLPPAPAAQASDVAEALKTAKQLHLASHPTWLKLLHYEQGGNHSVVLTDTFFLSPNGNSDPVAELTATIHAYFSPWNDNADEHARCRFPARYFWLSNQLVLPDYTLRETRCQRLEDWALFDRVKSVSFLLVSGYFGNPASTFGHALLKLNTDAIDDPLGFFDLTLNYGALIPEHENPLRYIAHGLFGGYEAGFSDRYFYTQDLVYTRTEFRDMWDYRLALSDYERTLLILHIWEIVGKKYTNYFLDKNCAYRLAELPDLAINEEVVGTVRGWYVPVGFFHRLHDIDRTRQDSTGEKLIQSVQFIPSSQRKLFHHLRRLTPPERKAFNAIVREGVSPTLTHLQQFTAERRIFILDCLLAYQQYRLVAERSDSNYRLRKLKDQILLARLQLPARPVLDQKIPDLPSPAEGQRPMVFGASVATGDDEDPFLRLTWSPFRKERVGQNSLEGDELVVFDLAVGAFEDEQEIFLDQLDVIRIFNMNTFSVPIAGENPLSWSLRAGVSRVEEDGEDRYDGLVSFGVGYAWQWHHMLVSYGMLDLAAHTLDPLVRVRPHIALQSDRGAFRTWAYFGAESASYDGDFSEIWGGKIQYSLSPRCALQIEFTNETSTRTSVGLNWYW